MLPWVTGKIRGNRRLLAVTLAVLGFAACNTYDSGLRVGGDSNVAGGGAGEGGSAAFAGTTSGGSVNAGTDSGGEAGASGSLNAGEAGEAAGGSAGMVVAGAAGTGAGGSTAGAAGLPNVAGAPSGSLESIDDFEDGDSVISLLHGRNGPWYTFSDGTAGGTLGKFTVAALTGSDAHDDSLAAAHLTASGFTDWGAGLGADFLNPVTKKLPYDVSAYKGVHFYAKVGSGASTALKVLVITSYSDPSGGICSDAMPATVPSKRCNDHLYAQKKVKTSWEAFDVLFTDLIQQGFGLAQPTLDPKSVYSLQFIMPTNITPVDLWIDDVSFIVK